MGAAVSYLPWMTLHPWFFCFAINEDSVHDEEQPVLFLFRFRLRHNFMLFRQVWTSVRRMPLFKRDGITLLRKRITFNRSKVILKS